LPACKGTVARLPSRAACWCSPTCSSTVTPFELEDKMKPGHLRFIALWLVDPTTRIISTLTCHRGSRNGGLRARSAYDGAESSTYLFACRYMIQNRVKGLQVIFVDLVDLI